LKSIRHQSDARRPGLRRIENLVLSACLAAGCGVTSPLFIAESDQPPDNTMMGRGSAAHSDASATRGMDGGTGSDSVKVQQHGPRRPPPCGTGSGCDPTDLGGESCNSLGLGSGQLLCDSTSCTFAVGLCTGLGKLPPCGSGVGCDPTNFGTTTCETLGLTAGKLACNAAACTLDTSGCGTTTGTTGTIGGLAGLFGATGTDADGGTTGGLFGGTAGGGFFGGTAGGGLFGGTAGGGFFGGTAGGGLFGAGAGN